MTDLLKPLDLVIYPESDGQPITESDPTRDYLLYCVAVLEAFFKSRPQVYVSGNLFVYYQEGNTSKSISPDVFVVFGVSKRKRRSYKTWQEGGKLPSFVMEITSLSTKKQDAVEKPQLYASLGVQEYFQYDPTGDYLLPQLSGKRLINGEYEPLPLIVQSNGLELIHSAVLGLDLYLRPALEPAFTSDPDISLAKELRFYDPQTGVWLLSYEESEQDRLQARQALTQTQQALAQEQQASAQTQQALEQAIAQLEATGMSRAAISQLLGIALD
jgi:Uma2 family endonuclease